MVYRALAWASALLVATGASAGGVVAPRATAPPHILFVLADDFGYNDIGYHQNQPTPANPEGRPTTSAEAGIMQTPTLDALAAQGVKLESYYVQPLCSPTRSALMTGRYPHHTGIGPDVVQADSPYGVPARETLLSELLKDAGYATHIVGKWHLGFCDAKYTPTFRGFDSFLGYLLGAQDYYSSAGDRNGTNTGRLPQCVGPAEDRIYSSEFFSAEASRIVAAHDKSKPLFLYLAMQNVHSPYDVPPPHIVNINQTFPRIVEYQRRIYAGMVAALDKAVQAVVQSFHDSGLWEDTVLVFSTDNGGIGSGNNYPLRGSKVNLWEGGIRGVGFVRGTDSARAPLPSGATTTALMHVTDWLPTLTGLASAGTGGAPKRGALKLDGFDQWDALRGASVKGPRNAIFHEVPARARPVNVGNVTNPAWSTTSCFSRFDSRVGICHPFGVTGGAIRVGDYKLLVTSSDAPWETSVPVGMPQFTPGGRWPNGSHVFVPTTNDTVPGIYDGRYYLFNITQDPTESNNLAASRPQDLAEMIKIYEGIASDPDTLPALSWVWGFHDNASGHPQPLSFNADIEQEPYTCLGPMEGSRYCKFGNELTCAVYGERVEAVPGHTKTAPASDMESCIEACKADANKPCAFWSFGSESGGSAAPVCSLFDDAAVAGTPDPVACTGGAGACAWGPGVCF